MNARSHRYTRRIVLLLSLAHTEARRMRAEQVHSEHLLLALLREPNGAGLQVLRNLQVNLTRVRQMSQAVSPAEAVRTPGADGSVRLAPQARKVIELAGDEARKLGHANTGTEHVLLGLLREGNGGAAMVLRYLNVTLEQARSETERLRASGHHIDEALPDREAARSLRAQMVARQGFPYRPSEARPAEQSTFTPEVRVLLAEAHACALRANRESIGAEHLLLALVRDPRGRAACILRGMGADVARLTATLEAVGGHSARLAQGEAELTPHARALVAGAVDAARRLRHEQVRPEHLLLSVTRDRQGLAIAALQRVGVAPEQVYARTLSVLREPEHEA